MKGLRRAKRWLAMLLAFTLAFSNVAYLDVPSVVIAAEETPEEPADKSAEETTADTSESTPGASEVTEESGTSEEETSEVTTETSSESTTTADDTQQSDESTETVENTAEAPTEDSAVNQPVKKAPAKPAEENTEVSEYTVTFNYNEEEGTVTVTEPAEFSGKSGTVNKDTSVRFTVSPKEGYKVSTVKAGGNDITPENGTYILKNIGSDTEVVVTFEAEVAETSGDDGEGSDDGESDPETVFHEVKLNVVGDNGTVTVTSPEDFNGKVKEGETVIFTVSPDDKCYGVVVSVNDEVIDEQLTDGSDLSYTLETIDSDKTIEVEFVGDNFGITPYDLTEDPCVTYEFYTDDTYTTIIEEATQHLQNGGELQLPTAPVVADKKFKEWVSKDSDGVESKVSGGTIDFSGTEDVTIKVYPSYENVYYVTFVVDGTVVKTLEVSDTLTLAQIDEVTKNNYKSVGGKVFKYWYTDPDNAEGSKVEKDITVSADTVLYAKEETGKWVVFDSNGGDYVKTLQVKDDGTVDWPENPTKAGYTFKYWTKDGVKIEEGASFEDNITTLVAEWEVGTANYTLQIWLENADDDGYTYERFYTRQAETGSGVDKLEVDTSYTKDGVRFPYNSDKTKAENKDKVIDADGTTVLNVYYTRPTYTLTFKGVCTTEEHQHDFWCYSLGKLTCKKTPHTHTDACNIKEFKFKYDQDLSSAWNTEPIKTYRQDSSKKWRSNKTGDYYAYLAKMPNSDLTLTLAKSSGTTKTWYYYLEVLEGKEYTDTKVDKGVTYYKANECSLNLGSAGLTYEEDYYPITGFVRRDSTVPSFSNNKAYLYYNRKKVRLLA